MLSLWFRPWNEDAENQAHRQFQCPIKERKEKGEHNMHEHLLILQLTTDCLRPDSELT